MKRRARVDQNQKQIVTALRKLGYSVLHLHTLGKGAPDQLYILCGTIITHGLQKTITEIFNEVHKSNMSKLDEEGKPIFREDGKILKSANFFLPRIKEILEK